MECQIDPRNEFSMWSRSPERTSEEGLAEEAARK
jgi:hypothetical protein